MKNTFNIEPLPFFLLFFLQILLLANSQLNTHQNLTFQLPPVKPYKLLLKQGDLVQATLFNTNAKFLIAFISEDRSLFYVEQGHCFKDKKCTLQFRSQSYVTGFVFFSIYYSHLYSYQISINSKTIKQQTIFSNTQGDIFMYPVQLQPKNYTLKFYYQSEQIKNLSVKFLGNQYQIKRNKIKEINVTVKEIKGFYQFDFGIPQIEIYDLPHEFSVKITALVPNQMLKGCNGYNIYDPKIKACGKIQIKSQDKFAIHRYGVYPHFTLRRQQTVYIKLTVNEIAHFMPYLQDQLVTVFLIHNADPTKLKQKPMSWILQNYQTQYQQTKFSNTTCSLSFSLKPGQYSFLPFLTNNFPQVPMAYLFQRFNNKKQLIQNYYSVFQSQYHDTQRKTDYAYFASALLQFRPTVQNVKQLVQIQIITPGTDLVMVAYNIFRKIPNSQLQSQKFQVVQLGLQNSFSPNMSHITILTDKLINDYPYLFYIKFHSKEFFMQHYENGTDKYDIDKTDPYLENKTIQFRIVNGRFPHKRINEKFINDDQEYGEDIGEGYFTQNQVILLFIAVISVIFIVFIAVICFLVKHFKNKQQQSQQATKRLISQYSSMISQNIVVNGKVIKSNSRTTKQSEKMQQYLEQIKENRQFQTQYGQKQKDYYDGQKTMQTQRRSEVNIEMSLAEFTAGRDD